MVGLKYKLRHFAIDVKIRDFHQNPRFLPQSIFAEIQDFRRNLRFSPKSAIFVSFSSRLVAFLFSSLFLFHFCFVFVSCRFVFVAYISCSLYFRPAVTQKVGLDAQVEDPSLTTSSKAPTDSLVESDAKHVNGGSEI